MACLSRTLARKGRNTHGSQSLHTLALLFYSTAPCIDGRGRSANAPPSIRLQICSEKGIYMINRLLPSLLTFMFTSVLFIGCEAGVERSPDPATLRVTLKANDLDTTIVILSDTSRFSRWDSFVLDVSQGRLYRGDNYAILYADISGARISGSTVNILAREWLNGVPITYTDTAEITSRNSRYIKYTVFESPVPPGDYDRLHFGLRASEMLINYPKRYVNPVQLPQGVSPLLEIPLSLTLQDGKITEVELEIYPFRSLRRYRDSFLFDRIIEVTRIRQLQ